GLPILCSFSILTDAMLPAMACSIVTVHAYLAHLRSPSRRWLLVGAAATAAGGLIFWEAYFQTLLHGIHAIIYSLVKRDRRRAALQWLAVTASTAIACFTFHFT